MWTSVSPCRAPPAVGDAVLTVDEGERVPKRRRRLRRAVAGEVGVRGLERGRGAAQLLLAHVPHRARAGQVHLGVVPQA